MKGTCRAGTGESGVLCEGVLENQVPSSRQEGGPGLVVGGVMRSRICDNVTGSCQESP